MRYICNSLVKRARSAHNAHKFVSMFFFLKALQPFKKREEEEEKKEEGKELNFHLNRSVTLVSFVLKIAKLLIQELESFEVLQ